MKLKSPPLLVAVVGGSGAGKSWLARELQRAFGNQAARVSLDDFYRDRSHLRPERRARVNFDAPRAIDWPELERVLDELLANRTATIPRYDFATHTRRRQWQRLRPKPVVIVEGLWLLRRPAVRRRFALRIFIDCPARIRLRRRLARDLQERGRTRESVERQFRTTVEPMHARFVAPQARRADVILTGNLDRADVKRLVAELRANQTLRSLRIERTTDLCFK